MINLLLGASGGGKSFEAVVFHVLPALRKGRKVITNLPLNLVEIGKLSANYLPLIELRQDSKIRVVKNKRRVGFRWDEYDEEKTFLPFGHIEDYGDLWRHPKTGGGALYVIDECHKCLPAKGTPRDVEEWYAEHRHEFADVLLITQSSSKVSKAVTDNCQVVYRVRKATAFGTNNAYVRKVQDGLRGAVVNETIRTYKSEFFKFYKSHTRSDSAGAELAANDIIPFWKRWPVVGAAVCLVGVVAMLLTGHTLNPMKAAQASSLPAPPPKLSLPAGAIALPDLAVASAVAVISSVEPGRTIAQAGKNPQSHPFEGVSIHIIGFIEGATKWRYTFSADQNGQPVFMMTQDHLEQSGYKVEKLSECSARIHYNDMAFYATCDVRSVGMASHGMVGD